MPRLSFSKKGPRPKPQSIVSNEKETSYLRGIGIDASSVSDRSIPDSDMHATAKHIQELKRKRKEVAAKNHNALMKDPEEKLKSLSCTKINTKSHSRIHKMKVLPLRAVKSQPIKLPGKPTSLKTTEKAKRILEEKKKIWLYGRYLERRALLTQLHEEENKRTSARLARLAAKVPEPIQKSGTKNPMHCTLEVSDNSNALYMVPQEWPDGITPFFKLPEKIRVRILKMIPHAQRYRLQLVCRKFRNEIRIRAGLAAVINDQTENGPVFMRDIIVDKIVVEKYRNPTKIPPYQLIGRSFTVDQLSFRDHICIPYFDAFISKCRRIKRLFLDAPIAEYGPPQGQPVPKYRGVEFTFRNAEVIRESPHTLHLLEYLAIRIPGSRSTYTISRLFQSVKVPNIISMSVRVGGNNDYPDASLLHIKIMSYIINLKHLKNLWIQIEQNASPGYGSKKQEIHALKKSELVEWGRNNQLKEIIFLETKSPLSKMAWDWIPLFKEQNTLEVFQVLHLMHCGIHHDIILRNQNTLRKIAIHTYLGKRSSSSEPFNLAIFQNCVNLADLKIWVGITTGSKCNSVYNFQALPDCIKVLALKNCSFFTNDFLNIVHCLPKLESVGVVCPKTMRYAPETGITLMALNTLFRSRVLNELLIVGFNYAADKPKISQIILELLGNNLQIPVNNNMLYMKPDEKGWTYWDSRWSTPRFRIVTPWLITKHI